MKCQYDTQIAALCPVDQKPDIYSATFVSDKTIMVEEIIAAINRLAKKPVYQEEITAQLARSLCCRVVTVGYHSGVKTTIEAP